MSELKTGVIGLGAMGGPMARHLAAAGLLAGVWNRTREKAEALAAELGVPVADSPAALASDCNVVLTCVSEDADLEAVLSACRPGLVDGDTVPHACEQAGGRQVPRHGPAHGAEADNAGLQFTHRFVRWSMGRRSSALLTQDQNNC